MFTDGLRDNLHDHEVLGIVDQALPPAQADMLGLPDNTRLRRRSRKPWPWPRRRSPWTQPTARVPFAESSKCLCGKPDNITIVAA